MPSDSEQFGDELDPTRLAVIWLVGVAIATVAGLVFAGVLPP